MDSSMLAVVPQPPLSVGKVLLVHHSDESLRRKVLILQ